MASQTTITIQITPPSNQGASAVDGYKIYRSTLDPGTDAANLIYDTSTDSSWNGFSDPELYIDNNVTIGDVVTYRVEVIRSLDNTTKEYLFGPYLTPGAEDLGYPNNQPSNTGGFPYFVDTEPLVHLRADSEFGQKGANYNYGTYEQIENHADSFSDFRPSGGGMMTKLWQKPDGTQTSLPILTLSGVNSSYLGYLGNPNITAGLPDYNTSTSHNADLNWHPAHQVFAKAGLPCSNPTEIATAQNMGIMLDDGVMTFSVSPARRDGPSQHAYPNDWTGHGGGLASYISTGADIVNYTNGQAWVDPSPPFGISVPDNPGFIHNTNQSGYGFNGRGHVLYTYFSQDARNCRIGQSDWLQEKEVFTKALTYPDNLHLVVTRQNGDGTMASVWVNGDLVYHKDPLIGAMHVNNTYLPQVWKDEAASKNHNIVPLVQYPLFTAKNKIFDYMLNACFAERMVFDKVLPKSDAYRAIFYFQNKFKDYLAPQDGAYSKL